MTQWFAVSWLRSWARSQTGQTMAEYAVILAVITPAIVAAFALLADQLLEHLEAVALRQREIEHEHVGAEPLDVP